MRRRMYGYKRKALIPSHPAGKYVISQKCYDVYMVSELMLSGRGIDASDISMYIGDELMFLDSFVHLADMFL